MDGVNARLSLVRLSPRENIEMTFFRSYPRAIENSIATTVPSPPLSDLSFSLFLSLVTVLFPVRYKETEARDVG